MNIQAFNDMTALFFKSEPICAVGHGVAGLCSAKREDGKSWSFKSYSMTGVTKLPVVYKYFYQLLTQKYCFSNDVN